MERHIIQTKSHVNIPVVKFRSHYFYKFSKSFTWIGFDRVLHLFDVTGLETCSQLKFCSWHKQGQPLNNYQQQWHGVALPAQCHISLLLHRRERFQHLLNWPFETVKVWPTSSIWNAFFFPVHLLCQLYFEVRSVQCPRRKIWDLGQSSLMHL